MKLLSFRYKESGWELQELAPLKHQTLLVARNAAGKTRTIKAIVNVAYFLQMKEVLMGSRTFEAELIFSSQDSRSGNFQYALKINDGVIERESLIVNDEVYIDRSKDEAMYLSTKINPPKDRLVVQVRRDQELYPDIEKLMSWAEGVTYVSTSHINPLTIIGDGKFIGPYSFSELVEALSISDKESVISRARLLGYDIEDLKTFEPIQNIHMVQIKERDIEGEMVDMRLSSGMIRVLYLLCLVAVIQHNNNISMLLIDDLGEGLDYRRAIDLGEIIFNDCKEHCLQLIASSNDAFLLDVIDLDNWQILRRNKCVISAINKSNSAGLFHKFQLTGLSNFDLFSSDFIDSYLLNNTKCER